MINSGKEGLPKGSHILFVCDVFDGASNALPNGTQRSIENIIRYLEADYRVSVLDPNTQIGGRALFSHFPTPGYPQIPFTFASPFKVKDFIEKNKPNAIINTSLEAPLGISARVALALLNRQRPKDKQIDATSAYFTNLDIFFSHYLKKETRGLVRISPTAFRPLVKKLYEGSYRVLVPTQGGMQKLLDLGLENVVLWPFGVDTELFHPILPGEQNTYEQYDWYRDEPLPIYLNYGRVSAEKNLLDFLRIDTPNAHKVVIGDGPLRQTLESRFRDRYTHFLGARFGTDLAAHVRSATIMIFPSLFDTWGLVVTEAGASGVPVVAYDVTGPGEIIAPGITGSTVPLGHSLAAGIEKALAIDRNECAKFVAGRFSWKATAQKLLENIKPVEWD